MLLIIDTCCLANVFNSDDQEHKNFEPVMTWIKKGKGQIVYGGTTYKKELSMAVRYFSLLAELNRRGRVLQVDDDLVDQEEKCVKGKEANKDFDDPHLIAIVIVSGCKVICTNDKRAHRFIKKKNLYPKGFKRPAIYSNKRNSNLLI